MIYKILTDFTSCLTDLIEKLSKDFNVIFFNNVLYISKKDPYLNKNVNKIINKNNLCIIEITEANLKNEPQFVQDWCKDKFVELDTIKFETEQQEVIKNILNFIDVFDNNVKEILNERGDKDE